MTSTAPTERPSWLPAALFPFQSRFLEIRGSRVHYVDEGEGPVLLLLHGNPTYSFRCVALDYPGFGLSVAAPGYDYRPETHSRVVEEFVDKLGLKALTIMVQDWGGPIGLGLAGRRPELMRALIIGNTWAWPADAPSTMRFSKIMGSVVGQFAIKRLNAFVNLIVPSGVKRGKLSREVMAAYRGARAGRALPEGDPRQPRLPRRRRARAGRAARAALPDRVGRRRRGLQGGRAAAVRGALPEAPDAHPARRRSLHPGGRRRGDRARRAGLVGRGEPARRQLTDDALTPLEQDVR